MAGADSRGNPRDGSAATAINLITKTEFKRPISKEPVSPIKIFAGEKLYIRKATRLPASEKAITAYINCEVAMKYAPKIEEVNNPRQPASPSTPSIRLKEFVITTIVKRVSKILTVCGICMHSQKSMHIINFHTAKLNNDACGNELANKFFCSGKY